MNIPTLGFLSTVPVTIHVYDGLDVNGADHIHTTFTGNCRYQEKYETVTLADGRKVKSVGKLFLFVDIAPTLEKILSGKVVLGTANFQIISVDRLKNPDGSFNHCVVRLM